MSLFCNTTTSRLAGLRLRSILQSSVQHSAVLSARSNYSLQIVFFLLATTLCHAANILYVIPFSGKSHYIMLEVIGLELARRGHNITVITAFSHPDPPPNYRQVMADNIPIWDTTGGNRPNTFDVAKLTAEEMYNIFLWNGAPQLTEIALKSKEVQDFLKEDNQFDLVICELFFQEATYALAHKYQAPLVLVSTFGNCMRHNMLVRNPLQMSTVIPEFVDIYNFDSFSGRLRAFYFALWEAYVWKSYYMPKQEALVRKYLKNLTEPVPSLIDLQINSSLLLVNSHVSYDTPMALLPNIVEIGGVHMDLETVTELPEDIKTILEESQHGIIYVSFGSNVKSVDLSEEKLHAFLNTFKKLKHTVIWKWEDDNLPNKPDNVFIRKWLPQKAILAHPNVKAFISHGGLIGLQEAMYHGVPIVGVPIFADQHNNLLQAQDGGYAIIIQYHDINERSLERTLNEILKDFYYDNAKELSRRFRDRPMSALDTAVFWIEYVIRHNGATFMRNPALELSWIQSNSLDIYAFILFIFVGFSFMIFKLYALISRFFTKEGAITGNKKRD